MSRLSIVVVLFFIATGTGCAQKQAAEIRKEFLNTNSKNVLVASLRAVHHELPENSIPAIKEGIRLGVDIIETDVKISKDGIPMLMHDGKVDRTTNGKGNLEDQNYEELRKLRPFVKYGSVLWTNLIKKTGKEMQKMLFLN